MLAADFGDAFGLNLPAVVLAHDLNGNSLIVDVGYFENGFLQLQLNHVEDGDGAIEIVLLIESVQGIDTGQDSRAEEVKLSDILVVSMQVHPMQ